MKREQKIVAIGAGSGVALMVLSVWMLTELLPPPSIPDALGERVAYALRANVVALVPLFLMLITVGNSRFQRCDRPHTQRRESIDGHQRTRRQHYVLYQVL